MDSSSLAAFKFTFDTLCDHVPDGMRQGYVYLWTITSVEPLDYAEFSKRFNHFRTLVVQTWGKVPWLRVYEVHPGENEDFNGHGLHAHCVFPRFANVQVIAALSKQAGLGRVDAIRVPSGKAKNYMKKYLTKTARAKIPGLKGKRLWAAVNCQGTSTRCKDIVKMSFTSWAFKNLLKKSLSDTYGMLLGYKRFCAFREYFFKNYLKLVDRFGNSYNLWVAEQDPCSNFRVYTY